MTTKLLTPVPISLGQRVNLNEIDAQETGGLVKADAKELLKDNLQRMAELQEMMFAECKHALLIVLQAMDAGGKDSTIRHVMDGFNPQGCHVVGFGVPTELESWPTTFCGASTPTPRREVL